MAKPTPPFNPAGSRYDQSTFEGRLSHFREMTDPNTLLVGDDELGRAQALLAKYEAGDRTASDGDLWEAKRIKDAIIHPVTGEKMFLPGRMSAFVPANTIPTAGMLLAKTPMQTIFWQWMNQSVNVMCNYVNRSGASVDVSQVGQAYALAVAASCGIAVGAGKLVANGPPWVKRLGIAVPYAAVVSAGAANVAFTRMPEMQDGVPITAPDGTKLGVSKLAAQSAVINVCAAPMPRLRAARLRVPRACVPRLRVPRLRAPVGPCAPSALVLTPPLRACVCVYTLSLSLSLVAAPQTVLSRNLLLPIAPMLLPPLAMAAVRSVVPLGAVAAAVCETAFVAGSIATALPAAIAVFPQEMKISTSVLEAEFQGAVDASGKKVEYVLCNKGL